MQAVDERFMERHLDTPYLGNTMGNSSRSTGDIVDTSSSSHWTSNQLLHRDRTIPLTSEYARKRPVAVPSSSSTNNVSSGSDSIAWSGSVPSAQEAAQEDAAAEEASDNMSSSDEDDDDEDDDSHNSFMDNYIPLRRKMPVRRPGSARKKNGKKFVEEEHRREEEGLPPSEHMKQDLVLVGRTILSSRAGEKAAERAQTLASIDWLASHVPNAVLDQLGRETRVEIEKRHQEGTVTKDPLMASMVESDNMSEVSDLSATELQEGETDLYGIPPSKDRLDQSDRYGDLAEVEAHLGVDRLDQSERYGDLAEVEAHLGVGTYLPRDHVETQSMDGRIHNAVENKAPSRQPIGLSMSTRTTPNLGRAKSGKPRKTGIGKSLFQRFVARRGLTKKTTNDAMAESQRRNSPPQSPARESSSTEESVHLEEIKASSPTRPPEYISEVPANKLQDESHLPYTCTYRCALLFVDISGFTKLSTKLDPESLSKAINSYFQLIVSEVLDGKGDLLKFAGDAVFIEWKATEAVSVESCVESAASCAAAIISRCADFSVLENGSSGISSCLVSTQAARVDTLNVHCGIGAGQMKGVHVGDEELRREYILLGKPIQQATTATDLASLGEVAVSPEAYAILARVCHFRGKAENTDNKGPTIIASRHTRYFTPKRRLGVHQPRIVNDVSRGVTTHVEGLEIDALQAYRTKMALYVHPVVVDNDLVASNKRTHSSDQALQERHREEAEIRKIYCMFVNPQVDTRVTADESHNREVYKTLNNVMNLSSREIKRFSGHLRQFIVDDKGLVMIITFGLRGTTIPNLVSQRALPATIAIHNALQMELGISSKIGATIGEAYCGVVGGVKRHEYAVLGPSVNLAARLMASETNPGILVENKVRLLAHRSYGFNALPPVVAKGYNKPVPIFEPLSPLERAWGMIQPNFVGRKVEIVQIMEYVREMVLKETPSKLVLIESQRGMGKSTMVAHCIEHIRKMMGTNHHRLVVTKNVSRESDSLVPFGAFREIMRSVLKAFRSSYDENNQSFRSGGSMYSNLEGSLAYESLSGVSIAQASANLTTKKSSEIIQTLCRELNMPSMFLDYAMEEMLGLEGSRKKRKKKKSKRKTTFASSRLMVSFMARAFKRCTQDAKVVILALDDLHNADELSWKVIREIYQTTTNVLIIGTTYPEDACTRRIEADFWKELTRKHQKCGRFIPMQLGSLSRDEICMMIMKSLGLQRKDVKNDILEGIVIQSGGMPHFVNEILEYIKQEMARDEDFEIYDMDYDSFGGLILQRLDSFDLATKNVLNIGAVIGLSFSLDEVLAVEVHTTGAGEREVRSTFEESLKVAVAGRLLECRQVRNDDQLNGQLVTRYSFYHSVWRTSLLQLMLEGRKRDLHKSIAETLEMRRVGMDDYLFNTKLFNHWVSSHNFGKAAELAMSLGKHFEERLGLPAQSIRLYDESLDLLRESNNETSSGGVGGFSQKVLEEVGVQDLSNIIRLQVALGQALSLAQQVSDSVTSYQDALRITQAARSSKELRDRSILFPVFIGLSTALKRGHITQDPDCNYEQAMLRRYAQETKIHGDPISIIHAAWLQADMFARLGQYDKAIECHEGEIEQLYETEAHSLGLCDQFGNDLGAQSYASSALWHLQLENKEAAMGSCWFLIEELLPNMEKRNVHASFMVIFPILSVMKDNGFAIEARECFEEYICQAYTDFFGEERTTFFLPLYDPVLLLLDIAGNSSIDDDMMEEYMEWALDVDNLGFGTLINSKTGDLGRTADSMSAEICYLLAQKAEEADVREQLIANGIEVASEDVEFCEEQELNLAEQHSAKMLQRLESLSTRTT